MWRCVINRDEINLSLGIYVRHDSNLKCRKIAVVTDTADEWTL